MNMPKRPVAGPGGGSAFEGRRAIWLRFDFVGLRSERRSSEGCGFRGGSRLVVEFRRRSEVFPYSPSRKGTALAKGPLMAFDRLDQTESRILTIVASFLAKRGAAGATPSSDQSLREAGLTSLDLVNLMLAIEGEFDIFIPEEKMTPQNFMTVRSIHALVSSLAQAAA